MQNQEPAGQGIADPTRIDGERVYLRRIRESDLDERYVSWFQDEELVRYYAGSKRSYTRESLLADIQEHERAGTSFLYGIFLKENDLCIGNIRLGPIVRDHKISDLVILIGDRSNHGKGLAVEAIRLGNRVAFELHDLRKLFGGMYEANEASVRAYTRAGWVIEGRLKGHYWVDGKPMDRILVGCFSPKYFPEMAEPAAGA